MNSAKNAGKLAMAVVVVLAGVMAAVGQTEKPGEQSYQVSLQFVMGTNDGGKSDLPAGLGPIAKELKNNFGFANYHVAATLLGRVGTNGNYEYKSVSNIFGTETASATPTFLEWAIVGIKSVASEKGRELQGSAFRFGARVPVFAGRDDSGKVLPANYENVGITAQRFGIAENTPTLIGTLSLPNTPGTVFLVVTARAVD